MTSAWVSFRSRIPAAMFVMQEIRDPDAHVIRDDDLRHGRHAHRIRPQNAAHADLCRRFIARPVIPAYTPSFSSIPIRGAILRAASLPAAP